jgi:hypothetical protein
VLRVPKPHAVELHQAGGTSTDISFDAELTARPACN